MRENEMKSANAIYHLPVSSPNLHAANPNTHVKVLEGEPVGGDQVLRAQRSRVG